MEANNILAMQSIYIRLVDFYVKSIGEGEMTGIGCNMPMVDCIRGEIMPLKKYYLVMNLLRNEDERYPYIVLAQAIKRFSESFANEEKFTKLLLVIIATLYVISTEESTTLANDLFDEIEPRLL